MTAFAGAAELFGAREPSRLGRKPLVPLFVIVWVLLNRTQRCEILPALGLARRNRPLRMIALGLACGVAGLVAFNVLLTVLGARDWQPSVGTLELLGRLVAYLAQALVLALLEESLFRGLLHGRLKAGGGTIAALTIGPPLFALAHFLRPPKYAPSRAWWDTIPACLNGVTEAFADRAHEAMGLFFVGLVLTILRIRTGSILLPLGVHAGWVWIQFISKKALVEVHEVVGKDLAFWGTRRIYDGYLGVLALLLTCAIAWWATRSQSVAGPRVGSSP